jgi:hypothetical protein
MKMCLKLPLLAAGALALATAGCLRINVQGDPARALDQLESVMRQAMPVRVATYNTSLYSDEDGGLVRRLEKGDDKARKIAAVLQRVRPDLVLLNEFDYDPAQRAADLFQRDYLETPQSAGGAALRYPYRYLAPVNTGVASGLDLDGDGNVDGTDPAVAGQANARRARGNDAWGYGLHPGQYGMLVLSRYPINVNDVRTFQLLKWSALPDAMQPIDPASRRHHYPDAIWRQLRLSSKSHWDVPVRTPQGVVHLLASHPTPPVFDGPENRNGARNFDEIRLWAEYLSPGAKSWLCDDQRRCGGLDADARFVIAGDLNADPDDGEGMPGAVRQLLRHPRVDPGFVPRSEGAVDRAADYALPRKGAVATHTGDFGPKVGTLRLDYLLPSRGLRVLDGAVFWPASGVLAEDPTTASDHHLVWLDVVSESP